MQNSCKEVASEFFATNAPDPPHWNLNWRFGAFHTIWVHSAPFGCLTKLGAKRAELVQKFVPRSLVEIFRNERARSTPLDPKLIFWCISYYLGIFGTIWMPNETRSKRDELVQNSSCHEVASEFFASNATDPPHWTLNSCFGAFHKILVHLAPFSWLTKLNAKLAELVQNFVPWSRIGIFHNERTRSTPLDPKLKFWCIWDHFITTWNSVQNGVN